MLARPLIQLAAWARSQPSPLPHRRNGVPQPNLRKLYTGLYINIAFLFVRNIYRFAEFAQETFLGWPVPEGTYVLADQQVRVRGAREQLRVLPHDRLLARCRRK
jgi:hypothetical protein